MTFSSMDGIIKIYTGYLRGCSNPCIHNLKFLWTKLLTTWKNVRGAEIIAIQEQLFAKLFFLLMILCSNMILSSKNFEIKCSLNYYGKLQYTEWSNKGCMNILFIFLNLLETPSIERRKEKWGKFNV